MNLYSRIAAVAIVTAIFIPTVHEVYTKSVERNLATCADIYWGNRDSITTLNELARQNKFINDYYAEFPGEKRTKMYYDDCVRETIREL